MQAASLDLNVSVLDLRNNFAEISKKYIRSAYERLKFTFCNADRFLEIQLRYEYRKLLVQEYTNTFLKMHIF